jgi:phosphatidylglycerophosphatase A
MAILSMSRIAKAVILFIAQGAYSGKSPFAPGTAGTVVGVLLYLVLKGLSPSWYLIACVLATVIGVWAAEEAEKLLGKKDAQSIVIDEIAGYLISMVLAPSGWMYIVAAFILFRVFDVIKPWPLKRLQDLRGGVGVVLDDVGAGIYTNVFLQVASYLIGRG